MRYLPAKPQFDVRDAIAEALQLYTEWRAKDEEMRTGKGNSKHDWRELGKDGKRKRGLSWDTFMSQGDMFRTPSEEVKILGELFAKTEELRSFDREDVESAASKKRVVDLITDYLQEVLAKPSDKGVSYVCLRMNSAQANCTFCILIQYEPFAQ